MAAHNQGSRCDHRHEADIGGSPTSCHTLHGHVLHGLANDEVADLLESLVIEACQSAEVRGQRLLSPLLHQLEEMHQPHHGATALGAWSSKSAIRDGQSRWMIGAIEVPVGEAIATHTG